ncbi:hypothetical protein DOTSEDRAFT_87848 [Dothistroma septosporum NZE10]|uniref:Short-chain dehydrogenase/oxidoreductase n=1 Tax=Dothistroma septosporum (strain NZE10 / CBS 128990) TaxID=675120 RepID=N1PQ47_DOTSN|nr:hypothetical protein DOTSEDRAFT_87848 [Dothistroma septosporum NZE10]
MTFPYKNVLLIGATSGIGARFAQTLIDNDVFVIGVGRRKDRLEAFVQKAGKEKADYRVHDMNDLEDTPAFVSELFKSHPEIDFVFLNSGIQRALDFTSPSNVSLDTFNLELKTNYTAPVYLTQAILPYLASQSRPTALAFTTSQLALITLHSRPNYGASKAALHHFILALREQLRKAGQSTRIVELYPPAVQTELHDSKNQPDLKNGGEIGMPLEDFNQELWEGLKAGKEDVVVGSAKPIWDAIETPRREQDKKFNDVMDEALKDFLA